MSDIARADRPDLIGRKAEGVADAPTVLVVDDSPENRYAVARALRQGGFAVREAETGAEGIELADEEPDLIVLDVNLPDIHGFEVCRRLKAQPGTAHIPILHASQTHVTDSARASGLEGGADAYLVEPVDPGVLLATARALLRMRRAEDRLRREVDAAEVLSLLTTGLADALTAAEVLTALGGHVVEEIGARDAALYVLDPDAEVLRLAHTTLEADPGPPAEIVVPLGADPPVVTVTGEVGPRFGDATDPGDGDRLLPARHLWGPDGAWALVPLVAYGRCLGALVATFRHPRLGESERALLVDLGERGGQALERAQLYEEQRTIATTLQAALLPAELPELPGAEIAARYVAGGRHVDVGGDFYDVFGRDEDWLLVIGDVCGRGARAAGLTALARHTIRAEARHLERPGEILESLHSAILTEGDRKGARFATAVCVRLHPAGGGLRLTAAVAGHPSPLVLRADGSVEALDRTGPLLGCLDRVSVGNVDSALYPGDSLVLYTDGVTEARDGGGLYGEDRLRTLLEGSGSRPRSAEDLADAILEAITSHAGPPRDDVAILILRLGAQVLRQAG